MSVRVFWDTDEKKIIWYVVEGNWTWDEFYTAYYEARAMQRTISHRFHAIIDLRSAVGIPGNAMQHVTHLTTIQSEYLGIRAIITTDESINTLYQAGAKFYSKIAQHFVMVQTVEQAYAIIAEADDTNTFLS